MTLETTWLDQEERDSAAYWAAHNERLRILAAMHRGEVSVMGKRVELRWPDGKPAHLDEVMERLSKYPD